MKEWTIKVFVKENGVDAFEEWMEEVRKADVEGYEQIRAMIRRLSNTKKWDRPFFSMLKGCEHICEIIVKTKDKQYRPLGCHGPGPQTFTLLVGASKKQKIWTPQNAKETARRRRKLAFGDRRYVDDYQPGKRRHKETPTR